MILPLLPNIAITTTNKWQGPALGARSGVRKNITHRKETEKQKLKMATMAPK